jgi:hypothetical protein
LFFGQSPLLFQLSLAGGFLFGRFKGFGPFNGFLAGGDLFSHD